MSTSPSGWIGVDLDGTLAHYDTWRGPNYIGPPVKPMLDRVKAWLEGDVEVRIFTARVCSDQPEDQRQIAYGAIGQWCLEHIGQILTITAEKDWHMIQFWDDRAVSVEFNTGRVTTIP